MTGLFGFVGHPANVEPHNLMANMAQSLAHKDWYQQDLYHDSNVGLGRVSLGISNPESQPIWNEDESIAIIMEGELFDYERLKERMISRGYQFRVNNDAEFALHMYEEFGEDFATQLNGAFALAIWDQRINLLLAMNDRMGLHPLYYANRNGFLTFASKVGPLLADWDLSREIDGTSIAQLMTFDHLLGDRTLLAEVRLLEPASLLIFRDGNLRIRSYWSLEFPATYQRLAEEDYLEGLISHLQNAVDRQATGSLPAGVLLSGGLDSRVVLAMLRNRYENGNLHTFTFGIPGCDDARFAKEIAALSGTHHHFYELEPDYLVEMSEQAVRITDGQQNCVHMHSLATLHAEAQHARIFYKGFLGNTLMGGHIDLSMWADYGQGDSARYLFGEMSVVFSQAEHDALFDGGFRERIGDSLFESFGEVLAEAKSTLLADRQCYIDLRQIQRRFTLNGVELVRSQGVVRTPYCDNELINFMLSVPPGFRAGRRLLRKALIKMAPDLAKVPYTDTRLPLVPCSRELLLRANSQIRWRLRNAGLEWIPVPKRRPYFDYGTWMRTALRSWVEDTLLSRRALQRGLFRAEYVRNLVNEHMAGVNHARKLGALLTIELWHRQFLD